ARRGAGRRGTAPPTRRRGRRGRVDRRTPSRSGWARARLWPTSSPWRRDHDTAPRGDTMRTRPFGPTGVEVPVVGQGTWSLERDDRGRALAALRRGLDLGMSHVDTAEMYGQGAVEELLAPVLEERRADVYLASKGLPSNASRRGTVAACERSLARLGTDHLDLYLLHWPGRYPLKHTIAAFEELRDRGLIRAWGLSNFDEEGLARAVRI